MKHETLRLWLVAFFVVAIAVLGVALRVIAMQDPLWLDELHTSWCVNGRLSEVFHRARLGNQGPLYFYLEYLSVSIVGHSEVALRLPSLFASIGLLVSIPWIVFRWSQSMVGAGLAMLLASIDDQFIFYAVEARPYALVQLCAVWQVHLFLTCLENKSSDLAMIGWLVLTPTLFYLHFTTIALLASQVAILVFMVLLDLLPAAKDDSKRFLILLFAFGIPVAMMLPGIQMLMETGQQRADWGAMVRPQRYGLMMVAQFVVYLLPALALACLARRTDGEPQYQHGQVLSSTALLVAAPLLFCYAGSVSGFAPLAHYRFSIASSTLLVLLAGMMFGLLNSRPLQFAAVSVTLVLAVLTNPLALPTWQNNGLPTMRLENWKSIAGQIDGQVLLCSDLVEDNRTTQDSDEDFQRYLKFPLAGIYQPVDVRLITTGAIREDRIVVSPRELQQLIESGKFQLLIRMWREDAVVYADRLSKELGPGWNVEHQTGGGDGPLSLFSFENTSTKRERVVQ